MNTEMRYKDQGVDKMVFRESRELKTGKVQTGSKTTPVFKVKER